MFARGQSHWRELIDHGISVAKLAVEVARDTGMVWNARPRGLAVLAQEGILGRTSPSSLYRYQAACQPHKVALIGPEDKWTFQQLDQLMDRTASNLLDMGVGASERIVLMLKNRPEMVWLHPAIGRAGASPVSVSWHATVEELRYVLQNSRARGVFFEGELAELVREAVRGVQSIEPKLLVSVGHRHERFEPIEEWLARARPRKVSVQPGPVVAYTSGTTGKPKGAVRPFSLSAVEASLAWISAAPFFSHDVHLAVLPLYHSTAYAFVNLVHLVGGTVVLLERFDPETFLAHVQQHRVTHTALVPTLLHRLVELDESKFRRWDISSLRTVITAGAPLPAALARRFMQRFGHVLYNYYGSTETGLNAAADPESLLRCPGTIGRPLPGSELLLLDEQGKEVAPGQVGELFVRGPLMIAGYHGNEKATQASKRGDFFSVGDLARVDEHGCYHIVGRKRDMIISGGVNVYPAEVEQVLAEHPSVAEIAVVGAPDEEWGEKVVAFVVPRGGREHFDLERLRAYAKEHLSGPKRPKEYRVSDSLPRTSSGKVLKRELRRQLEAERT